MKEITPKPIHDYCVQHSSPVSKIFNELSIETQKKFPQVSQMQVGPLEGNFLSLITKITQSKNILEFGTFTGHSSIAFALALPEQGRITTLDRDPVATALAKEFWIKAKVTHKVELILGDARETVQILEREIKNGSRPLYDLAFIDADKANYLFYFEACMSLLKVGGAILVDNVLWSGSVLHPEDSSDHAICNFNSTVAKDPRIELVMIPLRDGITLAIKK